MLQITLEAVVIVSITVGILLYCMYAAWIAAREWGILYWLERAGNLTDAEIVGRYTLVGGKSGRCFVAFRFHHEQLNHTASLTKDQQVSLHHYRVLADGRKVKIRYLVSDPNIARLSAEDIDNTTRDSSTFFLIVTAITIPLFLIFLVAIVSNVAYLKYFESRSRSRILHEQNS